MGWGAVDRHKADRLVNIPDNIRRELEKAILQEQTGAPDVFKKAERDVLNLMTDNIYTAYVKSQAPAPAEAAPAPSAAKPSGGGCCIVS